MPVTYDQTMKWLVKNGGECVESKQQMRGSGSIMASVRSAKGGVVQ